MGLPLAEAQQAHRRAFRTGVDELVMPRADAWDREERIPSAAIADLERGHVDRGDARNLEIALDAPVGPSCN